MNVTVDELKNMMNGMSMDMSHETRMGRFDMVPLEVFTNLGSLTNMTAEQI